MGEESHRLKAPLNSWHWRGPRLVRLADAGEHQPTVTDRAAAWPPRQGRTPPRLPPPPHQTAVGDGGASRAHLLLQRADAQLLDDLLILGLIGALHGGRWVVRVVGVVRVGGLNWWGVRGMERPAFLRRHATSPLRRGSVLHATTAAAAAATGSAAAARRTSTQQSEPSPGSKCPAPSASTHLEVEQHLLALAEDGQQAAAGRVVLAVLLQVGGQLLHACRQACNLHLRAAGVRRMARELRHLGQIGAVAAVAGAAAGSRGVGGAAKSSGKAWAGSGLAHRARLCCVHMAPLAAQHAWHSSSPPPSAMHTLGAKRSGKRASGLRVQGQVLHNRARQRRTSLQRPLRGAPPSAAARQAAGRSGKLRGFERGTRGASGRGH